MEEQQQFVDVEQGAILWTAGEDWKRDDAPVTRSYRVVSVRPKTLLISGAISSQWEHGDARRYDRVEAGDGAAADGAVARSGYAYGMLYRTEQDAVRALVAKAEGSVERSELRLEGERAFLSATRALLAKISGGAAVVAVLALVALVAPSPAAAQSSGFSQYISTPSVAGRATITANGYFKRTTAPRRATGRVTFILYRAAGPGFSGTRIKVIERTLRPGQNRVDVSFSVRRTATSRVWTWFGFIRYSVSVPGRSTRYFEGTGHSALYRVR